MVASDSATLKVFLSREGDVAQAVTFLPGFPDGSFGWAKVRPHLPNPAEMPKLFLDYLGMGDSDKPKNFEYSSAERADLVEAIWQDLLVQSTTMVAFDFSSLVILEILRRRLERLVRGEIPAGPKIRGVFIFYGGLFAEGHTHPWYTTPMLRWFPDRARRRVGRPFALFKRMPGVRAMWSKGYRVTDGELRELHSVMTGMMASFTSPRLRGLSPITKHKANGLISVSSSRLIVISSLFWWAAATKIHLSTGKLTSHNNDWASSASGSSDYRGGT
jgi:pimeloyl-ACP methyl ester carboxylesterase